MNLNDLLAELEERGVKLGADGDQLRIRAPKGVITPKLRDALAEHKAELIKLLSQSSIGATSIPLIPISQKENLPLSFQQERLWILAQVAPVATAHNIAQGFRLTGQLSLAVLEQSLNEIVRRHEALRTTLIEVEGNPVQNIAPNLSLPLSVQDFQDVDEAQRWEAIWQVAEEEAHYPFDLTQAPLWRLKLMRLTESEHVLLLVLHHIISDVLSMGIFIQELGMLYEAFCMGKPSPLPEISVQYGDFAVWQREWLKNEVLENQLAYWKKQLHNASFELKLPTDRPKPLFQSFRGKHKFFKISPTLWKAVQKLSYEEQGITPFMTFIAAFKALLHRCSQQEDILIGFTTSGRVHPKVESIIGFFGYPLLLRTTVSGNLSFQKLLSRVRQVVLEGYAHQNVPFGKLVEVMGAKARSQNNRSFQTLNTGLTFISNQVGTTKNLPNLTLAAINEAFWGPTDLDLYLNIYEVDEGLQLMLLYNTDIFNADTIEALVNSYCQILEQCVQSKEVRLSDLSLTEELATKARAAKDLDRQPSIAIAATFTSEPVADTLAYWMEQLDLPYQIEFAPYNQVFQQLLSTNSLFAQNQQGINIVLVRLDDWTHNADRHGYVQETVLGLILFIHIRCLRLPTLAALRKY